jgi:hypothetical protein
VRTAAASTPVLNVDSCLHGGAAARHSAYAYACFALRTVGECGDGEVVGGGARDGRVHDEPVCKRLDGEDGARCSAGS